MRVRLSSAVLAALLFGLMVCLFSPVSAQEIHTLTTPQSATTSTYTLRYVGLDVAGGRIVVEVVSNAGAVISKTYDATTTPTGVTLLHNLNTANFTSTSLVKAVFNRLIADGVLPPGTVSGSPQ